ncbi:MAG: tetratricopeptide repeat protein [Desulfobulbaceae bacterium]|nr:tetratricopeptide repeat protein [Desulfobulbaceae bacterium]
MSNKVRLKKIKATGAQPPAVVAQTLQTAQFLHQSGNFQQAEEYYRQVLAVEPSNPRANNLLGTLYYQHGNLAVALPLLEKAIRVQPDYVDAHNLLGSIHLALGNFEQAISCCRQVLKYQPDSAMAHNSLGIVLQISGQYQAALASFQRALALQPQYVEAQANQGIVYWQLGRIDDALASYGQALILRPDFQAAYANFSALMKLRNLLPAALGAAADRKNLLINCLNRNDLQAQNFFPAACHELFLGSTGEEAQHFIASPETSEVGRQLLAQSPLGRLLSEPLFLLLLRKTIIADPFAERFLTRLRQELTLLLATQELAEDSYGRLTPVVCALAQQCFWNEYVWQVTAAEGEFLSVIVGKLRLASSLTTPKAIICLALLACYAPLYSQQEFADNLPGAAALTDRDLAELLRIQLFEPRQEKELAAGIRSFSEVSDEISQLVRQQYEENPYPRWTGISLVPPRPFTDCLRQFIAPHAPQELPAAARPLVLVAGCGTGQHAISCATYYLEAAVVAVDLSRASLAYAQRQAAELGITNIEFIQGDILDLAKLNKTFDVIECSGVLHHMRLPAQGLAVLVDLLRPAGYLKIGLYSEIARQHIVAAREFVQEHGFAPTLAGIRASRQALWALPDDHLAKQVASSQDFYAASTVRDLIFHVQEHRFTLPQIAELLAEFNLEFLGFDLNVEIKSAYLAEHGDDPGAISLADWHLYEEKNPGTFIGMYDFWVRKKAPRG